MIAPDPHSFSTIDSIDCELSVVSDRSGEKVKTVARIKIRTYTAIMPPTMNAIAFQTLFARLFFDRKLLVDSGKLFRQCVRLFFRFDFGAKQPAYRYL